MKKAYDIGIEKAKYDEKIKQLRHTFECRNITNLMCMLCIERRKCLSEKNVIENYYKAEIHKLTNRINDKTGNIKHLTKALEKSKKETNLRETCILEIIKQYQKFINFVLRSAPTQAEFMLSIEKMMIFELTDHLLNSDIHTYCETMLKWKSPTERISNKIRSIELKDGHDCMHVIPPPNPDTVLPAFTYKDKLYIREDFQSILSKLENSEDYKDIWLSTDGNIEMLIDLMKKSVEIDNNNNSENTENIPKIR